MTMTTDRLPMILTEVSATSVERISPSFVRVELASPDLADFGVFGEGFGFGFVWLIAVANTATIVTIRIVIRL